MAGIGNIFLGDDGFGVEVARRLAREELPSHVAVRDFGIRGLHLAYEMLDGGYGTTIFVDALPRGGAPGTVYLLEPEIDTAKTGAFPANVSDGHGMDPGAVLRLLQAMGGVPGRVLIVGCEPALVEERMGLSASVEDAVSEAVRFVRDIIEQSVSKGV